MKMACMKLGSKADNFQRKGQAWFCSTGLPSDIRIEVGDMFFHLHKFPLISRSGKLEKLIQESTDDEEGCYLQLHDIPGGATAFELVAKFCYGVKLELTALNVLFLRCIAEYLEMTEAYGEGNLISRTEIFLNQVVLPNWKESIRAVQGCEDVLPHAEKLQVVKRCVDSIAMKACSDPSLFGWPMMDRGSMQSPGGSVLWNGISTGARLKNVRADWWYEDVSVLSLPLYKRLISSLETRGVKLGNIGGALTVFAKRHLPGLTRRQGARHIRIPSEEDGRHLLETVESLLPMQKSVTSTSFLFGLLRTAMILNASSVCKSNLERRIAMQLDQAMLEDLLIPNYSHTVETLYDCDCVQRIVENFVIFDQASGAGAASPSSDQDGQLIGSTSLTPITKVAKLMDAYLAEVAPDINLKLGKFQSLAAALPEHARPLDDGLYRAIDTFLKAHPWITDQDREQLCKLMDCQKLSLEACTHAAQNERLPLRVVVQVLFFEQMQLRTAIAGCFLVSENLDASRPSRQNVGISNDGALPPQNIRGEGRPNIVRENQVLKTDMDIIRARVLELEKECSSMRKEIDKLGKGKGQGGSASKTLGFKLKSQFCSTEKDAINNKTNEDTAESEQLRPRKSRHKQSPHLPD